MSYIVTKFIEIDAGHRVPYHNNKCRHLHGHRYRVTAVVEAPDTVPEETQRSDAGMVVDFGVLKAALMHVVDAKCDHKLLLWEEDPLANDTGFMIAIEVAGIHSGLVLLPCIPTAEKLAEYWGRQMMAELALRAGGDLEFVEMQVQETGSSEAVWLAHQ